jgi:hypothetical protein
MCIVMDWNYAWAAAIINFLIVYLVPRLFKKPTGIKVVDDTVLYLNAQKSFMLNSTIIIIIVVYLSHYWIERSESGTPAISPSVKSFSE